MALGNIFILDPNNLIPFLYICRSLPSEKAMLANGEDVGLTLQDSHPQKDEFQGKKSQIDAENNELKASIGLKRTVGLVEGICLIVGIMIGSGIFASPRSVARMSKSVGMSLAVWAGCGVIAIFGALSYLELGLMFQGSGNSIQNRLILVCMQIIKIYVVSKTPYFGVFLVTL